MNRILIASILVMLFSFSVKAQKINITQSENANKKYAFVLHKGIDSDTIQTGTFNFAGNTIINIPGSEKDYKGMGAIQVEDGQSFSMIINKESFSATQSGKDTPYIFTGSKENSALYGDKKDLLTIDKNLYASQFIEIIQFLTQLNNSLYGKATIEERANVKIYARRDLNMEALYTSSVWHNAIDGLMRLNINEEALITDINQIVDRIESPEILAHLTENVTSFTQQYGLETAFQGIVSYIKDSGKIAVPQDKVYEAFLAVQVRRGTEAPKVIGLKDVPKGTYEKTLLIFHQPDCTNCQEQMKELKARYKELENKKVRVVTISSDHDKEVFEEENKSFPWTDNLCDFQGYAGPNYINFGIMATPTYILLDNKNIVLGRYGIAKNIPF